MYDWPLAICDVTTFDDKNDAVTRDVVYSEWTYENIIVHFNENQKWFYFPGVQPKDVIIFQGGDSQSVKASGKFCYWFAVPNVRNKTC